jgi:hypothetical protein
MSTKSDVADGLIELINATGGITRVGVEIYAPVADPDWTDLGALYIAACAEKCEEPLLDVGDFFEDQES